ncbi:MAG: 16S rRNA (guanine(527)-N(7))-methyltransferase RsmG [Bacteroidota bacterium]
MSLSLVFQHFPNLTAAQKSQMERLYPLYHSWNEKINVVSRKDVDQLYVRHVLHSLAIAKFIQFSAGSQVLDIGTGGGFPGVPLAILFPETQFHLVDSIHKKVKVVEAVSRALELKNISTAHQRAEKVNGQFDFVVSRAVARTKQLASWSQGKIKNQKSHQLSNGLILLKGGDLTEELQECGRPYIVKKIGDYFENDFFETKKIVHIPMTKKIG